MTWGLQLCTIVLIGACSRKAAGQTCSSWLQIPGWRRGRGCIMPMLEGDGQQHPHRWCGMGWSKSLAAETPEWSNMAFLSKARGKVQRSGSQKFQMQWHSNSTAEGKWAGLISLLTNSAGFGISADKMLWKDRKNQGNISLFSLSFFCLNVSSYLTCKE